MLLPHNKNRNMEVEDQLGHLLLKSLSEEKQVSLADVGGDAMIIHCTEATFPYPLLRKSLHQLMKITKYKVIIFFSTDEEFLKELPIEDVEHHHQHEKQFFTTTSSSFASSTERLNRNWSEKESLLLSTSGSYKLQFISKGILLYFTVNVFLGSHHNS